MHATGRHLVVVVNPTKVDDLPEAQRLVAEACERQGWQEPVWVETTEAETGERQAREAVAAGAACVASFGGDGTVRAVAAGLVGTGVTLGLLPGGTGNLLARNLGLPVDSLHDAVEVMLTGGERAVDVGWMSADDDPQEAFLVMTGLGFDGDIMADVNETAKGLLGWPAYVVAAARHLVSRGFPVTVRSGGLVVARAARTVLVGNCGTLQGGLELMPDAALDDGLLDTVVLAPKGLTGWLGVVADVLTRHRSGHRSLDRLRGSTVEIEARRPEEAEIDGDPIGPRSRLRIRVEERALRVRVGAGV